MLYFKKTTVLLMISFQIGCGSESKNYQPESELLKSSNSNVSEYYKHTSISDYSKYIGMWNEKSYDSNKELVSSLSLTINDISQSKIGGDYCYISRYGNKIDCDTTFEGTAKNDKQYLINFTSSFDNLEGKALLTLNKQSITWTLKDFPADLGVPAPKSATLLKGNKIVSNENSSSTIQNAERNDHAIKLDHSSSKLNITDLPITIADYTGCNVENSQDYCADRYPLYNIEDLPFDLTQEFDTIYDPETVLRLPNIGDIEIYILARNATDVEEYAVVTYKDQIIDTLLVGRVGTMENDLDQFFSISNGYNNIEIIDVNGNNSKLYKIAEDGSIGPVKHS